ncbi:uncharacterized protein LOC132048720 [Lycium ferocissimum]|uniref:uncharacterized protein LOC132048720 n=1 Tax=Lycium ferocissimum TaxID=112874 RepID=UPI0028162B92|nr:uncharacterized protein LOC132048720 [Lycium ferocissimum]
MPIKLPHLFVSVFSLTINQFYFHPAVFLNSVSFLPSKLLLLFCFWLLKVEFVLIKGQYFDCKVYYDDGELSFTRLSDLVDPLGNQLAAKKEMDSLRRPVV